MISLNPYEALIERIYWLIRLRWIAIVGVLLTVSFVRQIFKLSLPFSYLYTLALILGIYNLAFAFWLSRTKRGKSTPFGLTPDRVANLQISFDLTSLAGLIHFSGGIENPFLFYFIFHMIIASILLSRRASFFQATYAVILFSLIVILEYPGAIPHYCLKGFATQSQHNNPIYISGVSFVFVSTLYIAVYMATSISKRLRERERSLEEANELLNEKDRIKSEYVLRITHDIKEHLAAIQSCIEPVTKRITGSLNEAQMNLLQRADDRAGKLMAFVKALLEISSIKLNRHIEMDYFSLRVTVENAINFVDSRAKSKDISINREIDPGVDVMNGAQIYIEETIANLLANSTKYTPRGGKIDIGVENKGEDVLIRISDTGIGIPKDEIDKIFDEFYRARNAREVERDGTGLGLSIAKQVMERHGGKIWAESEGIGKGSIFNILLPK